MAEVCLSEGEKLFIIHSVSDNCRTDGRKCLEYRKIDLETDVISGCHGSCHVRIGKTDLLVGVKLQIDEPADETPDEGRIEFSADCSANASPVFEGRGGQEIANDVIAILSNSISPAIDRKGLCLIPEKAVWLISIDILILEFSSKANLIDASGIGVKAALITTRSDSSLSLPDHVL
jgi:exosome complex component RRP42